MTTQQKRRYALGAGLGLALVAFLVVRGRSRGGGGAELVGVAGAAPGTSLDPGAGGGSSSFDPTSLVDLLDTRLGAYDAQIGDIRGSLTDLEDFLKEQGATLSEDTWRPPDIDPDWDPPTDPGTPETEPGPAGQAPVTSPGNTKAAAGAAGFFWNVKGRRTLVTAGNRAAFLAELKRKGVAPALWAYNHPAAAKKVGIAVPKKDPKKKPQRALGAAGRATAYAGVSSGGGGGFLSAIARAGPPSARAPSAPARTIAGARSTPLRLPPRAPTPTTALRLPSRPQITATPKLPPRGVRAE